MRDDVNLFGICFGKNSLDEGFKLLGVVFDRAEAVGSREAVFSFVHRELVEEELAVFVNKSAVVNNHYPVGTSRLLHIVSGENYRDLSFERTKFYNDYSQILDKGVFSHEVLQAIYYDLPANADYSYTILDAHLAADEGDVVFDPFMGSGTTAVVAKKLGRKYVGFELEEEYIEIAKRRLAEEDEILF